MEQTSFGGHHISFGKIVVDVDYNEKRCRPSREKLRRLPEVNNAVVFIYIIGMVRPVYRL